MRLKYSLSLYWSIVLTECSRSGKIMSTDLESKMRVDLERTVNIIQERFNKVSLMNRNNNNNDTNVYRDT